MRTSWFRIILNKKVVGVTILTWLLLRINLNQVGQLLYMATISYVVGALLILIAHVLMKILRYKYILSCQNIQISYRKTMHYCLAAIYLSFITPGRIGELSKSYFIHKSTGVNLSKLLAGSIIDRIFDVYVLFITAALGVGLTNLLGPNSIVFSAFFILFAFLPLLLLNNKISLLALSFINYIPFNKFHNRLWFKHIQVFLHEIAELFSVKMLYCLIISVGAYLLFYGSCFMMAQSISIPLSYQKIAFFIACTNILSFLPISFAGIGTREASLVYLFSTEGLTSESALAFSVLIFTLTYLFFGIVGFVSFMTLDYSRKDILDNA